MNEQGGGETDPSLTQNERYLESFRALQLSVSNDCRTRTRVKYLKARDIAKIIPATSPPGRPRVRETERERAGDP